MVTLVLLWIKGNVKSYRLENINISFDKMEKIHRYKTI